MIDLPEDNEEAFVNYEEQIVYQIQSLLHLKEGLESRAVLEVSARLEELIYAQTLKHFNLSATVNIWAKKEYIQHFQQQAEKLVTQLKTKNTNWKKLFDDNEKNPANILKQIMKEDGEKKKSAANRPPKAPKDSKESLENMAIGIIAPAGKSKASKAPKVKSEGRLSTGAKGTKKKGSKETALTIDGSIDEVDMFAGPSGTEAFDDSLFGGGDMDLFDENALEMDDLFKFGNGDDPLKF